MPSAAAELMFELLRPTVTNPAPALEIITVSPALGLAGSVMVNALALFAIS